MIKHNELISTISSDVYYHQAIEQPGDHSEYREIEEFPNYEISRFGLVRRKGKVFPLAYRCKSIPRQEFTVRLFKDGIPVTCDVSELLKKSWEGKYKMTFQKGIKFED